MTKIVQIRRRPATTGMEAIVGERGVVRRDGYVLVHGELWRAHAPDDAPLPPGQEVEIERVEDGLTLSGLKQLRSTAVAAEHIDAARGGETP